MTKFKKNELVLDKTFDPQSCRHTVNGNVAVLHCHHYTALYTQLAMDCSMLDAKALLADCSEDTWLEFFCDYFKANEVVPLQERIAIGEQAFAAVGLGKLRVICAGIESGEAILEYSHVDDGWINKWGKHDQPVNMIGAGFLSALFAACFDKPARSYVAFENESIVSGAICSRFNIVVR